ncbi:MAG TPA: ABC transporter ATP-binding protein [Bacillota bacterium]|nr:ABC transporter ATP-binding protein [Bacillota bacterium]
MSTSDGALQVQSMTKVFRDRGGAMVRAVDGVSFEVKRGEVLGLLGPNGAGKTTSIKCILGLMRPDSGQITLLGQDVQAAYPRILQKMSAVLEGSRNLYWRMSVWENVSFFAALHGVRSSEDQKYFGHLLKLFGLEEKRHTEVRKLSQGMKQKASVVCALARRTPLVFLDEPTLGLDVETSLELRSVLKQLAREEERTFVVSSHDMDVIQDVCGRVVIMSSGRVVVDDKVSHLMSLFRTRAYRIGLRGSAPQALEEQLAQEFAGAQVAYGDGDADSEVRVSLSEDGDIYRLMDILRSADAVIDEITHEEVDLEKVYLEIVREERARS